MDRPVEVRYVLAGSSSPSCPTCFYDASFTSASAFGVIGGAALRVLDAPDGLLVLAVRLHGDDRHDEERQYDHERGVGHNREVHPSILSGC